MSSPILTPRTATVVLYQGDDYEIIAQKREAAEAAAKKKPEAAEPRLLHEQPEAERLAAEHDEFLAEANERAITVELRALGRKQWRDLVAAHPARDGNEEDAAVGVNEETFSEALVPVSLVEPTFETDGARNDFLDSLSDAQFGRIYMTAFALNRTLGAAPKALRASEPSPSSSGTES